MKSALRLIFSMFLLVTTTAIYAQTYPIRSIRLVVPLSAGGGTDQVARLLAIRLSESLGQTVFIENKPGAGGNLGSDYVAKSPPDGYTLVIGTIASHGTNVSLYGKKMPYDAVKDFTPITLLGYTPLIMMAHPSLGVSSVKELIGVAKARPGQINYASSGNGTFSHLGMEMIKKMAGIDMVHVPYKGAGQGTQDLLAGHVSVQFDSVPAALPLIRSGKVLGLGVTSGKKISVAPELPPIGETLPGFEYTAWVGLLGPANMPKDVLNRLNVETAKILNQPDFKEQLAASGFEASPSTPEAFSAYIKAEISKLAKIVNESGARLD
jgi:tripartite-type tricarboxylate transporter receptor subunit TctC